jgi:phosphate transport system substrate-binding protein
MNTLRALGLGAAVLALAACTTSEGRDQISIVGSSTVFPFSSAVAEHFAARGQFRTPKVESTGTGGGIAIFCRGIGLNGADIANASRPMKKSEYEECQKNGVTEIVEISIGHDGIVLANTKEGPRMALTKAQIWLALAKQVPGPGGALVPNPYTRWSQVDASLPDIEIDVMGPPPTSGTRDAFNELVLLKGAADVPAMAALKEADGDAFKEAAQTLREDGAWKDSGENDNLIVQALTRNPEQFGVFGFSFYEENLDRVASVPMNGVAPTFESISSGDYKAARSMFFYIKKQHVGVVPGLREFTAEFMSARAAGPRGYLRRRGMVPLTPEELAAQQQVARDFSLMAVPEK